MTNTLFIQIEVHTSQIALDPAKQDQTKLDLCDTEILKLEQIIENSGTVSNKDILTNICSRKRLEMSPNEFVYNIKFIVRDFVLDDTKEQEQLNLHFENIDKVQNETISINYFSY